MNESNNIQNHSAPLERYYRMNFQRMHVAVNSLIERYSKPLFKLFIASWLALLIACWMASELSFLWFFAWPTLAFFLLIGGIFATCLLWMLSVMLRYGFLRFFKQRRKLTE
jgi:hypothetical protein